MPSLSNVSHVSDFAACAAILRRGSRSFSVASHVLPAGLRGPVAALYALCREADDAVDTAGDVPAALAELHDRLDRIYAGDDLRGPVDRAVAQVVHTAQLPRAPFDALLEGFAWDAEGRTYETLDEVMAYGVRVAGSVGVLMTWLMGVRESAVLARACDLGVAMQLTNIARDVGEDARLGRLYLPRQWLRQAGIDPEGWLRAPLWTPAVGHATAQLLEAARPLYGQAEVGIGYLPPNCRFGICAARLIYADIGKEVARQGYNSVEQRAVVSGWRKLGWLWRALAARFWTPQRNDFALMPAAKALVQATERAA